MNKFWWNNCQNISWCNICQMMKEFFFMKERPQHIWHFSCWLGPLNWTSLLYWQWPGLESTVKLKYDQVQNYQNIGHKKYLSELFTLNNLAYLAYLPADGDENRITDFDVDQFTFGMTILGPITIRKLPGRSSKGVNQSEYILAC